jgi:hypothetical protein
MAWAGWGAGPAGAGSAGGPSRWFLVLLLGASGVVTVVLLLDRQWLPAGVAAAGTAYFGLRAAGRLGRRGGDRS